MAESLPATFSPFAPLDATAPTGAPPPLIRHTLLFRAKLVWPGKLQCSTTRLGFKLNTEAGQSYDAFEDVDLDNSTTHHSGLFFRIKGSASSTAAIDMGKWHAAIEKIIAMKLKSAVGVLGAMAEKWQRNSPMQ